MALRSLSVIAWPVFLNPQATRSSWPPPQLGLDQAADLCKTLGVEVGGVGPVDHLEGLVITGGGGGGELFKSLLGDEGNLDVGPCRKLNKSVAQAGMKTMQ